MSIYIRFVLKMHIPRTEDATRLNAIHKHDNATHNAKNSLLLICLHELT